MFSINTNMQWTNSLILEFLKLYEQEPAIWNPKHGLHRDRNEIADSWRRLEANFSVECPIEELKRKKDSLMATYRSLRNKIKQKERDNWGSEDTYKPNWFAYDAMFNFLGDVYQPKNYSLQEIDSMHMEDLEDMDNSLGDEILLDPEDPSDQLQKQSSFKLPQDRQSRKRKEPGANTCMCDSLNSRDECSLYSQLLAKKLRSFDDLTREVVMHEIDNFVFRAKLTQKRIVGSDLIGGLENVILEEYADKEKIPAEDVEAPTPRKMATVLVKREARSE